MGGTRPGKRPPATAAPTEPATKRGATTTDASPAPPPTDVAAPLTPDRRVNVIEVNGKACTHEVAWPPGDPRADAPGAHAPPPPSSKPPAKRYPFSLDPFQATAVACLEAGHSVMVAAHTSAGKTVVAEYAFAAALRDGTRAIYTSPLKALSNQKYRELAAEFKDVGLMTGDVTINPAASCLVMTTEVLRSMLYNRSDTVTEAATLVFDEVHYLRDAERGVVWEEAIALAPRSARFAFLSATLPNAAEFASWVATTHGAPVHVVYTDYRPTPLVQYVYPEGGAGLHLCVDEKGAFRASAFSRALADLDAAAAKDDDGGKKKKGVGVGGRGASSLGATPALGTAAGASAAATGARKLVTMLTARGYDPAIFFSFSKRECEAHSKSLADVDLNSPDEAALVARVFNAAIDALPPDDRALPGVAGLLPTLKRGIGVHHSGLLPVIKEVTEILFGEGLLKVLFATETFSTGLNMPAKTVVFTGVRKWDGGRYRTLTAGEYTQMAGRAGRRGLDDRGVVVLMLDTRLEPGAARALLRGGADPLTSAFRLSYMGLLTMVRAPDADPRALLDASYAQFQARRALPALQAAAVSAAAAADAAIVPGDEASLTALADARSAVVVATRAARDAALTPRAVAPFLAAGRVVLLRPLADDADTTPLDPPPCWGAVVGFQRVRGGGTKTDPDDLLLDVVARWGEGGGGDGGAPSNTPLPAASPHSAPAVRTISLAAIDALSSVRIHLAADLRAPAAREAAVAAVAEVERRFGSTPAGVPRLDEATDLGAADSPSFQAASKRAADLAAAVARHPLARSPDLASALAALSAKWSACARSNAASAALAAASGLVFEAALTARTRVLRKLGHVDGGGVVTMKGRAAAELASAAGAELPLAELIFSGALSVVRPDALAALLSCVAWREPSARGPARVPDSIDTPLSALRGAARRVARLEADVGLDGVLPPDDAAAAFSADVADAVLLWARGGRFADCVKAGPAMDGALARVLRRVDELARQLAAAAEVVGDGDLAAVAEAASAKVKRGVPFAPSLYL